MSNKKLTEQTLTEGIVPPARAATMIKGGQVPPARPVAQASSANKPINQAKPQNKQ